MSKDGNDIRPKQKAWSHLIGYLLFEASDEELHELLQEKNLNFEEMATKGLEIVNRAKSQV